MDARDRAVGKWVEMLRQAAAMASCLFGCACASVPPSPYTVEAIPLAAHPDVTDSRGRFREIFCTILEERAATLPDARTCDDALTRCGDESAGTGRPVELGFSNRRLVAAIVEGVGWNCVSNWLDLTGSTAEHVRRFGYDVVVIEVESLSSSEANARQIRDAIMAMEHDGDEPHIVLIGYSKGAPDTLEAVVAYPEIRRRIAAVVSAAGAVGGSPLADEVTQSTLKLFRQWPGAQCSEGDGGAVESLRPAVRKAWLEENPLPHEVPYYSLVTCPEPERISMALKSTYKKLSKVDARNDGMMLFDDQLVPGSTFIACVNADHWSVSVPIARTHPTVGSLFVDENDYPREALLETILRFVEEDLATSADSRKAQRGDERDVVATHEPGVARRMGGWDATLPFGCGSRR